MFGLFRRKTYYIEASTSTAGRDRYEIVDDKDKSEAIMSGVGMVNEDKFLERITNLKKARFKIRDLRDPR